METTQIANRTDTDTIMESDPLHLAPIARPPGAETQTVNEHLLVLLPVENHRLVLLADTVREVITVTSVTPLPMVTRTLLGAVAVRGALLPIYDVRTWCGEVHAETADPPPIRFGTILDVESGSFAIQTTEHPTIMMSEANVRHRSPVVVADEVCIGIDPVRLLHELTADSRSPEPEADQGVAR